MITIAVDCMGGDIGPAVTMPACEAFLASHPQARLLLVGRADALRDWPRLKDHERCTVVAAAEVVEMSDPIEVALRRKKDSSMRVAIQQVKEATDLTADLLLDVIEHQAKQGVDYMTIHAGVTIALGSLELQYTRGFSNYRKADVASRVTVPKKEAR